ALLQPHFAIARVQDYSWALSLLVAAFAPVRLRVRIEALPLGADRGLSERLLRLCFPSFWLRLPRLLVRYTGALFRRGLSYPITHADTGPQRFTAVLIELLPRQAGRVDAA